MSPNFKENEMKCKVFQWSFSCNSVSPDDFYEFEDIFRQTFTSKLTEYVGDKTVIDLNLIDTCNFEEGHEANFTVEIPIEHYNDADFDIMEEKIEDAADEYLGGWSSEQLDDEDV